VSGFWPEPTAPDRAAYADAEPRPYWLARLPARAPEPPLRWAVVALTQNRMAAADRGEGRRGLWLRALDRLGLGFDS
jgi:hypothetical protein